MSNPSQPPIQRVFADPGPALGTSEFLFAERPEFEANLRRIADHICSPLTFGAPETGMTFAILGPWGSGKTSALDRLVTMIAALVDPDDLTVTRFPAPLFEPKAQAQASLSYAILRDAETDLLGDLLRLARAAQRLGTPGTDAAPGTLMPEEFDLSRAVLFQQLLRAIEDAPLLVTELFSSALRQGIQVVLVDDLDRCQPQFVVALLKAMQEWRTIPNLSFVLAMSEDRLLDAMRLDDEDGSLESRQIALQKYVHVTAYLPPLIVGPKEVLGFLLRIADALDGGTGDKHLPALLQATAVSLAHGGTDSLLAPLFAPDSADTPRNLKHRLNTFLTEYRAVTDQDRGLVRRWVIKAFWPDLWWRFVWEVEVGRVGPGHGPESASRTWLVALTKIGGLLRPLWNMPSADLRTAVQFLLQERGLPHHDVDPAFAVYLAQSGWTPPGTRREVQTVPIPSETRGPTPGAIGPIDRGADSPLDHDATADPGSAHDPLQEIYVLYLKASRAESDGDLPTCHQLLREILALGNRPDTKSRAGATIGNAALMASRIGETDLAFQLHRRALDVDPRHLNLRQNFVEFVYDSEIADAYPEAVMVVRELLSQGRKNEKSLRSEILACQLADRLSISDLAPEGIEDRIVELASREPTVATVERVNRYLSTKQDTAFATHVLREVADRTTDNKARAKALESLGGILASQESDDDRRLALDLFRFSLARGYSCLSGPPTPWVLNWVAQLFRLLGHPASAAAVFDHVVRETGPTDYTRTMFAHLLDGLGHGDAAIAVMLGHPYKLPSIPMHEVPSHFAPLELQWWISYERAGPTCQMPDVVLADDDAS